MSVSEMQRAQYAEAESNWYIVASAGNQKGVIVEAAARTGSKYVVEIHELPLVAQETYGGKHLVSILQPWQTNMVFTVYGDEIHANYLIEKLLPRDKALENVHGGDVAGMVLTVNEAVRMMDGMGIL